MSGYGCHVSKCSTGKYTFVGSVPIALCDEVKPTHSDILGCNTRTNENGVLVGIRVKVFDSEADAREFAKSVGVELAN